MFACKQLKTRGRKKLNSIFSQLRKQWVKYSSRIFPQPRRGERTCRTFGPALFRPLRGWRNTRASLRSHGWRRGPHYVATTVAQTLPNVIDFTFATGCTSSATHQAASVDFHGTFLWSVHGVAEREERRPLYALGGLRARRTCFVGAGLAPPKGTPRGARTKAQNTRPRRREITVWEHRVKFSAALCSVASFSAQTNCRYGFGRVFLSIQPSCHHKMCLISIAKRP